MFAEERAFGTIWEWEGRITRLWHRSPQCANATVLAMNSSGRFSSSKHNLLFHALQASGQTNGDYTAFNRCMSEARAKGLTWVQGLDYTVKKLQPETAGEPQEQGFGG